MSLLMPALLGHHLSGSSKGEDNDDERLVAFMKIDCEVTDTRLLYLNKADITLDYLKILALGDQITTESTVRLPDAADDGF